MHIRLQSLMNIVLRMSRRCLCCRPTAAGVASKAEALEGSLAASKDQLLRLTADFENFRKRTVSRQAGSIRQGVEREHMFMFRSGSSLQRQHVECQAAAS
jgi:hypothetical protein